MASAGAATLLFAYSGAWVSYFLALPLLLLGSLTLLSLNLSQMQGPTKYK